MTMTYIFIPVFLLVHIAPMMLQYCVSQVIALFLAPLFVCFTLLVFVIAYISAICEHILDLMFEGSGVFQTHFICKLKAKLNFILDRILISVNEERKTNVIPNDILIHSCPSLAQLQVQ